MASSCNKDDIINDDTLKPAIALDNENRLYTVKVGKELTISPVYSNVSDADYQWAIDGVSSCSSPVFRYTWSETGKHYVTINVSTIAGEVSEELKVEVVDLAPPAISLPIENNTLTLMTGSDYVLRPEIANSDIDDFKIEWKLDGKSVGNSAEFSFHAESCGEYHLSITASNTDGSDMREINIIVVETLPFSLSFPTPSLFQTSTDRYTFVGRPVYLTPITKNLAASSFNWSVNGTRTDCESKTFPFTPSKPGEYTINVTIDNLATTSVKVICVDATEQQRYRRSTASSSPQSTKVFEWVPAPGQYIGETQTGGMTGDETTLQQANLWAEQRLKANEYVSLGGFGGYIIVGFDHSIAKNDGKFDFAVMANAFLNATTGSGGSSEPGIVYVMQDVNGNGLPDDEWYELRGSETGNQSTRQDYAVTYFRPTGPCMNVQWTDNYGGAGFVDYLGTYHRQPSYYPAWITSDSYTLSGTCLKARTVQNPASGMWDNNAFGWGYADNMGSDNIQQEDSNGQRNGFLIENAIFPDLSPISLQYIDFIKVQTGVNSKAGWLGEVSTEVLNVQDLSLMN